jgi:hypothetical protein
MAPPGGPAAQKSTGKLIEAMVLFGLFSRSLY